MTTPLALAAGPPVRASQRTTSTHRRTMAARALAATTLTAVALVGTAAPAAGTPTAGTPTASTPILGVGQVTRTPAHLAVRVEVERTGGLYPSDTVVAVNRQSSNPAAPALFALIDSTEFHQLDASYPPPSNCCDLYFYTVTVRYHDRTTKTVDLADSSAAPQVAWDVVRLVLHSGEQLTRAEQSR